MKRIIGLVLCFVLIMAVSASAQVASSKASAVKTATALIYTGETLFTGILIATDGTNAVTLDVYDGTSASGTKIIPQQVIPSSAVNRSWALGIDPGVLVRTGIYVVVSVAGGGSCSYTVYYK